MTAPDPFALSEAVVRRAWEQLVSVELPRAAAARGWPVRTAREFERILLDQVLDDPGDRPCSTFDLILAIELGERALSGKCCPSVMQRRSEAKRSKRCDATERLLSLCAKPPRRS